MSGLLDRADIPAYFVAFGPHGPRAPTMPEGNTMKVLLYTGMAVVAAFGIFTFARSQCKLTLFITQNFSIFSIC